MFAIGHFALGYLFGKAFSKLLDVKINMALLFTVSVIPDIDLLLFRFAVHRGATHSILFSVLFCSLLLLVYRKKAVPYCAALLSHSLIGDIFSGGIQLFWPLSRDWIYLADLSGRDIISVSMELSLFAISIAVMLYNKDFQKYFLSKTTNWTYWIIPSGAVLGPMIVNVGDYGYLPTLLILPSLFYIIIFSYAALGSMFKKDKP